MSVIHKITKNPRLQAILSYGVFSLLTIIIMSTVFLTAATWIFSSSLPNPSKLSDRVVPQSTKIYDRNGKLLYEVYHNENRTLIQLDDLPDNLVNATLAAEDANFYHHDGIDVKGLSVAAYQTVFAGQLQGGSTITQQLVKMSLLQDQRRTVDRKIKEAILALQLERTYSKDEILQMYVNEMPYGGQVYGVEAAAKTYFGKSAKDLTLGESALLAGLTQSPSNYSPFEHRSAAISRQHYVLHLMQKSGFITAEQEEQAKTQELAFASPQTTLEAPWFTLWVKDLLEQQYGRRMVEEGGLRVTTTLDLDKQAIAQQEVGYQMDRLADQGANANQGALLSMDPKTGQILTMVGSKDYYDQASQGNVNATLAQRQPGSSIKPFVYLSGMINNKITPATMLDDTKTIFNAGAGQPAFIPQESDGKFWGPMMAHDALANSRNIPTVQVMQKIGLTSMISTAEKAGISSYTDPSRYGLSLSLGGGEVSMLDLTTAYTTLANNGVKRDPVAILKVENSAGKVLDEYTPNNGARQFDERYTYLITHILSDNVARQRLFGAGNLLEIGRPAAVKTGTTNDNKDAWTAGYTPDVVTVVWVGNFDSKPMNGIQGSTGATPIWHHYMQRVLEGVPASNFTRPAGIVEKPITTTGRLSCSPATTYRVELFVAGTEPTLPCTINPEELFERKQVAGEQITRDAQNSSSENRQNQQQTLRDFQQNLQEQIKQQFQR